MRDENRHEKKPAKRGLSGAAATLQSAQILRQPQKPIAVRLRFARLTQYQTL
jgi:hypothetical protein